MNKSFRKEVFPEVWKFAEMSPIFKKNDSLNKENYRPETIDQSVFSHMYRKYFQGYINNWRTLQKAKCHLY